MNMLKIEQLTSIDRDITSKQQKQVIGGSVGLYDPKTKTVSSEKKISPSDLWGKYADGTYDLNNNTGDNFSTFNSKDGEEWGSVNQQKGEYAIRIL